MPTGGTGGSQAAEDFNKRRLHPARTSRAASAVIIRPPSGSPAAEQVDISQVTLTVDAEVDTPEGRAKVQASAR